MDHPKIYVIVVTYNGMRWLDRCFGSIAASELPVRAIVVDNGSTDGTVGALRAKYPAVEVIETGENLGFGRANNIGIRRAMDCGCDYVYLMNQDAWVDPGTIGGLAAIQAANPGYFVLSPMQVTGDRKRLDGNFRQRCGEKRCPGFLKDMDEGSLKPLYRTRFVMAAHWLVPRRCLETIGGFADIFPHYGEDNNYCDRICFHGYDIGICPSLYGVHDRQERKPSAQATMRMLYVTFLIKMCDINRNMFRAGVSAFWNVCKRIPVQMLRYRSAQPLRMLGKGVSALGKIRETRRRTKKAGPNYL